MANSLTIQLRPTSKYSPPTIANLFHNAGLSKATYWIKNPDSLISNLDLKNLTTRDAVNLWRKWEEDATNSVLKNKGKNPQKKQVLIEEGLMVIGKDVLEKDPKIFIKIFEEFKEWFEKKYNTKITGYFFHNHEGHIDQNTGDFSTNLHIHFFFLNVDKFGNSVRRQIKKSDLSFFQDKIFEIGKEYIKDLERATNYKELGLKAPKHKSHREFRTEQNKQMQLKLAPIAKENKELNAKIKDLSMQEMQERFNQVLNELREKNAKLEQENLKLKQENQEFIDLILEPEKFNTAYELNEKIETFYKKNEEKLDNTKKIKNRNEVILNYLNDFKTFDNYQDLEKKNEEFGNKIKTYKKLNDEYFYTDYKTNIEEYKDKIYLISILSKRIDFLMKKLEELNKRLKILSEKIINKLEQNDPGYAEYLTKKLFKSKEQKDNQIKQTNYSRPKL